VFREKVGGQKEAESCSIYVVIPIDQKNPKPAHCLSSRAVGRSQEEFMIQKDRTIYLRPLIDPTKLQPRFCRGGNKRYKPRYSIFSTFSQVKIRQLHPHHQQKSLRLRKNIEISTSLRLICCVPTCPA